MNQGHGSIGSGRGSERTGLVHAWWMLTEGSATALTETGKQGLWSRRHWKLSSSRNGGGGDSGTQGTAAACLGDEEGEVKIWSPPPPLLK